MLIMTCSVMNIGALSAYTVYILRAMGYKCKASQDLKLAEAICNPWVFDNNINEWRAKLRDAFGIDAIPIIMQTMQQLYGDASSMK